MALPKIGLQAVLENSVGFQKSVDAVNKKMADATKQMQNAAKSANPLSQGLNKVGVSFDGFKNKLTQFSGVNAQAVDGILQMSGALGPMAVALGAAAIAAVGLGAGFLALGSRGASLIGLAESFDNLTASVGISSKTLLVDLRAAANGTISDFDLIRRANLALVGSTGEFGKAFGKNLPKILEAARAAARATGQDVDFLFQSLVAGIKRASPRLIDNTGIVLKLSEAEATLAEQLGKSVEALTLEEKQIAVLNATVAAGQNLIDSMGTSVETAAEKIARSQASITNIFDTLGIAIQPAFGAFMDAINGILGGIEGFVRKAAPFINLIAQGFAAVIKFIGEAIKNIGKGLLEGGYNALKGFATGMATAINKLVFPVIIGLARLIADFLIGQSPPPMGPLSDIDKGGENVMLAWLDGFAGVNLDPVSEVAKEVSILMGDIGKASISKVNARLAELDKALLPFQNRLAIVKSQFEAIEAPAKAALEAIDRQMEQAQEALARGDVGAADTIRRLDAAREAIQGQLDAQQSVVDQQQIQLGLASASQAQERALLEIRKAQLAIVSKVVAKQGGAGGVTKEPKAPTGSGAPIEAPGGAVGGGFVIPESSVLDDTTLSMEQLTAAANDLFGETNVADFTANQAALNEQLARFQTTDPTKGIAARFKGLTDIFDPSVDGSVANVVSNFFSPDASVPGSFASFINSLTTIDLTDVGAAVGTAVKDVFSFFTSDEEGSLKAAITTLTGDSTVDGSVANFFSEMPQRITDGLGDLLAKLKTDVFDPVTNFLSGTEPGTFGGIINDVVTFFTDLPTRITTALQSLGETLHAGIVVPVVEMFNSMIGVVETGLKNLLQNALDFAGGFVGALGVFAPPELAEAINALKSSVSGLTIPRIPIPALGVPTAAKGGLFGPGAIDVGEHGKERIFAADKIGILPAELTRALEGLGSMLAQPSPMTVPAGNTTNNSSSHFNFNGVQSDNDARRRYNSLRAGMR